MYYDSKFVIFNDSVYQIQPIPDIVFINRSTFTFTSIKTICIKMPIELLAGDKYFYIHSYILFNAGVVVRGVFVTN